LSFLYLEYSDSLARSLDGLERDSDPRKELGTLGVPWKIGEFTKAAHEENFVVLKLFVEGGMKYPSEDVQWHLFRPDSGSFPYASYIFLKEHSAFNEPEAICANPELLAGDGDNQFFDPIILLNSDPKRLEIARWLCSISTGHSQLMSAIDSERARIGGAAGRNSLIKARQEDCIRKLRRQLGFNVILEEAGHYNILEHDLISDIREKAVANMAAALAAGQVRDDPRGSYERALTSGCTSEIAEGTDTRKLERLEKINRLLF
jgi:hypothetical protein